MPEVVRFLPVYHERIENAVKTNNLVIYSDCKVAFIDWIGGVIFVTTNHSLCRI